MSRQQRKQLRRYRRASGLEQADLAFLLGGLSRGSISRYEWCTRRPDLETAFAYQLIFGVPAHELFEDIYAVVDQAITDQAHLLAEKLAAAPLDASTRRKLRFLRDLLGRDR
jgi:transcriptional regulator with XRE-family HTH domain